MPAASQTLVNVGLRLSETARRDPDGMAVAETRRRSAADAAAGAYRTMTFRELDEDSDRLAAGLLAHGARPGMRLVLLVPPGIDFISLVFAMFKAGLVSVLIDPGMGRRNLLTCLSEVQPDGFVTVPLAQAVRALCRWRFPRATVNVTVGRRWFWRGSTLAQLRGGSGGRFEPAATQAADPAAVIFTTGSTGPPKGVLYRHGNFSKQVDEIRDRYDIQPGEIDLPGFPLFALFNCAMGVSTVIPEMDFTRPARVDPRNIVRPIQDWQVTQAFGSPALWNVVGRYCEQQGVQLPSLRRVLSAGAPVPPPVLSRICAAISPEGEMHTPYGATEALPVASISAREVLGETAARTRQGAGTCVGRRFPGIRWKVIRISDDPIASLDQVHELSAGEIGELIVQGDVVTTEYVTRRQENALHKIADGAGFWHRMGDVGYLDDQDRFWFCGRRAHRVGTLEGVLYTVPCEAIFNQHPGVERCALVGVGSPGRQRPLVVVEPAAEVRGPQLLDLIEELKQLAAAHDLTRGIRDFLIHPSLPVDIRHNSKIFREQLAVWAARKMLD